jgi:mRNA-degrading endonuclease RelE of RelBE toxin-antitoxin system
MIWRLRYTNVAKKQLRLIREQSQYDGDTIAQEIDELQIDPTPGGLKPLRGTRSLYRLRVPPYRVLYKLETGRKGGIVRIFRIELRSSRTYRGFNP